MRFTHSDLNEYDEFAIKAAFVLSRVNARGELFKTKPRLLVLPKKANLGGSD